MLSSLINCLVCNKTKTTNLMQLKHLDVGVGPVEGAAVVVGSHELPEHRHVGVGCYHCCNVVK